MKVLNGPTARIYRFHRYGRGSTPRWGIFFLLVCNFVIRFVLSTLAIRYTQTCMLSSINYKYQIKWKTIKGIFLSHI
jgi:hypothetical protein